MKMLIKKLHCSSCQRLVTGREQKANNTTRILCSRCGKVLRVADVMSWHGTKDAE